MKCLICGSEFEPKNQDSTLNDICDDCAETREEVSNGKGEN